MANRIALQAEWDGINAEVAALAARREQWIEAHKADFARWPIGTQLVEFVDGSPHGVVVGHTVAKDYWNGGMDFLVDTNVQFPNGWAGGSYPLTNEHCFTKGPYLFGTEAERREYLARQLTGAPPQEPGNG